MKYYKILDTAGNITHYEFYYKDKNFIAEENICNLDNNEIYKILGEAFNIKIEDINFAVVEERKNYKFENFYNTCVI